MLGPGDGATLEVRFGVVGVLPSVGGGALLRSSANALIFAARSGLSADPLPPIVLGAGLLAALTLPRGVEEGVMPAVLEVAAGAADVETLRGDIGGGFANIDSCSDDSGGEEEIGDSRGASTSLELESMAAVCFNDYNVCPRKGQKASSLSS